MNILILNQILFTADNGIIPKVESIKDTMIYGMCLGFKKLGHNVSLVAAEDYKPIRQEIYDFEVIFVKTNLKKIFNPSVLPYSNELIKLLNDKHEDYDLIISSELFSFQSLYAAKICPHKTIIWQELTTHQKKFHAIPSKIWYNIIVRLFMRNVMCVIPRSKKASVFVKRYIQNVSDTIIDHGIDIDKFKYSAEKKRQVISSSQLIYRKNVDGIIRKFAKFHKMEGYEDIRLIIAGRGDEENNLKTLTAELVLQDYVDFVGFLSQAKLNEYIRNSCAFLVNTRKDLNMVSIPEAIVSGTPILTNRQPASADYIEKFHLGIVKDSWDENDIKNVIDNNIFYVENCVSYRDRLTSTYSAGQFVKTFNDVYSKLHQEYLDKAKTV